MFIVKSSSANFAMYSNPFNLKCSKTNKNVLWKPKSFDLMLFRNFAMHFQEHEIHNVFAAAVAARTQSVRVFILTFKYQIFIYNSNLNSHVVVRWKLSFMNQMDLGINGKNWHDMSTLNSCVFSCQFFCQLW